MSLGEKLKGIRQLTGLTLKELAEKTGVTPSLLSQIERGVANPSITSLRNIASCLGISIGYFFDSEGGDRYVCREADRKALPAGEGLTCYVLSRDTTRHLQASLIVFEVGARTSGGLTSHNGEEWGIVIEGTIHVQLGESSYILQPQDTISFSSANPHELVNIGNKVARVIWVNYVPTEMGWNPALGHPTAGQ